MAVVVVAAAAAAVVAVYCDACVVLAGIVAV